MLSTVAGQSSANKPYIELFCATCAMCAACAALLLAARDVVQESAAVKEVRSERTEQEIHFLRCF
jgi:hypothetical protein